MDAEKFEKQKNSKKPLSNIDANFETDFRLIIQHTLEEVLEEVQSQINNVSIDFKTSLKGIEKEIKDIKSLAQKNRKLLINISGVPSVEEKEPELISTGFDILTKVPSHLRRTYSVMLSKFDKIGATASDVAKITAKSRPLESDYLNQLFEKGLLRKKTDPDNSRKVIFIVKSQDNYKVEEENHNKFVNHIFNNNPDMISHRKKTVKAANEDSYSTINSKDEQKNARK